jgi:lysozyme
MDYNRATSPGTAGCIGILDKRDMQKLVDLLRQYDPKILKVDWGL